MASPELVDAVFASSKRLGINPSDLLTAISYETAGTFDPAQPGPKDAYGVPRSGLIQWGTDERKKYGVPEDMNVPGQMQAVERYLTDRGVKPGHGMLDIYSAINAGRVGRYNASDANNGGAPGTVADKVATQMVAHRAKANGLLANYKAPPEGAAPGVQGATPVPPAPVDPNALPPLTAPPVAAAAPAVPQAATPASNTNPIGDIAQIAALMKKQQAAQPAMKPQPLQPIEHPEIEYMRRAQIAQAALVRQQQGS